MLQRVFSASCTRPQDNVKAEIYYRRALNIEPDNQNTLVNYKDFERVKAGACGFCVQVQYTRWQWLFFCVVLFATKNPIYASKVCTSEPTRCHVLITPEFQRIRSL